MRPDQARDLHGAAWRARIVEEMAEILAATFRPHFRLRDAAGSGVSQLKERSNNHMTDVVMPQMGESIVEGTLTKWLKKPGDHVERDEPLFEISTDKVDTEIPSPAAGTLAEVLVEEGKTVGINTVVARSTKARAAAAAPRRSRRKPEARAAAPRAARPRRTVQPTPAAEHAAGSSRRPRAAAPSRSAGTDRSAFAARAPMARENNHRSQQGEGYRRRRPHHQAGPGGSHRAAPRRQPRRAAPAPAATPGCRAPPPPQRAAAAAAAAAPPDRPRRASSR